MKTHNFRDHLKNLFFRNLLLQIFDEIEKHENLYETEMNAMRSRMKKLSAENAKLRRSQKTSAQREKMLETHLCNEKWKYAVLQREFNHLQNVQMVSLRKKYNNLICGRKRRKISFVGE